MTTDGGGDNADDYPVIPENSDTSQGIIQINLINYQNIFDEDYYLTNHIYNKILDRDWFSTRLFVT